MIRQVEEMNALRRASLRGRSFTGRSYLASRLDRDKSLEVAYITAMPHMQRYMEKVPGAPDLSPVHGSGRHPCVFVDEVLLDLTPYLKSGGWTPHGLVREMIRQVLRETGITATAGIGTNLYLCKVAMDIVAKHMEPDPDGVRIAALTERTYRQLLWDHCPMTDFWRIGPGITRKLQRYGMYTMGRWPGCPWRIRICCTICSE